MLLKLKRTPGIFLVGFMGSGKSTVGEALAEELGWSFLDLDAEIERSEGTSIANFAASNRPHCRVVSAPYSLGALKWCRLAAGRC